MRGNTLEPSVSAQIQLELRTSKIKTCHLRSRIVPNRLFSGTRNLEKLPLHKVKTWPQCYFDIKRWGCQANLLPVVYQNFSGIVESGTQHAGHQADVSLATWVFLSVVLLLVLRSKLGETRALPFLFEVTLLAKSRVVCFLHAIQPEHLTRAIIQFCVLQVYRK